MCCRSADTFALARQGINWRADSSSRSQHSLATLLYAVQCPPQGGSVEFVNLYSVFGALPRERQLLLEKLRAVHDHTDRSAAPHARAQVSLPEHDERVVAAEHPLVRIHPVTRRKVLCLGKVPASRLRGLAPDEGRKLISELEAFATQPRFIYSHRWRKGDVIIWDNRCTLHRMTPLDRRQERILHRVQVKGEVPVPA